MYGCISPCRLLTRIEIPSHYAYVALSPWALDCGHSPDQLVASEASAGLRPVMAHTIFLEKGDVLQGEFGQLLDSLKIGI